MRRILEFIISFMEDFPESEEIRKTSGSLELSSVLNSYPEYKAGKEKFKSEPKPQKSETRGAKQKLVYSDDVEYLAYLVEAFYKENQNEFTVANRRTAREIINKAATGETKDFFSPSLGKWWIDMFSALEYHLKIFSKNKDDFETFFENYTELLRKVRTTVEVPFYARWIRDISALYTVYLSETKAFFDNATSMLNDALEKGLTANGTTCFKPNKDTYAVSDYITERIFSVHKKDKEAVLSKLCEYIYSNAGDFVHLRRSPDSHNHRYYCTIKEMLDWLKSQKEVQRLRSKEGNAFFENELIDVFTGDVDYELKDSRVKNLERFVVKLFAKISGNSDAQIAQTFIDMDCFIDDFGYFGGIDDIVVSIDDENNNHQIEDAVDAITTMLRLFMMVVVIYQSTNESNSEHEIPSKEDIVLKINQTMNKFGLIPLPTHTVSSYNEKTLIDICTINAIEEMLYFVSTNNPTV